MGNLSPKSKMDSVADVNSVSEMEIPGFPSSADMKSFETIEISKWSEFELVEFFETIYLHVVVERLTNTGKLNIESGKDFLELLSDKDRLSVVTEAIKDPFRRIVASTVARHILLRKLSVFTLDFYRVLLKVLHSFSKDESFNYNFLCNNRVIVNLEKMCYELCEPEELCKYYTKILKDFVIENSNYDDNAEKVVKELEGSNTEKSEFISVEDVEKKDKEMYLPVKLIITESAHTQVKKIVKRIISPVVKYIPQYKSEFGMYHVALLIGNLYLEWTDMGVVQLKVIHSESALCFIDFDNVHSLKYDSDPKSVEGIALKISEVVHLYNTKKSYSLVNNKLKVNCHHFVENLMSKLNISFPRKIYSSFFDSLQMGKGDLIFIPSKELRKKCKLKQKYKFQTHSEVDEVSFKIINNDEDNEDTFSNELKLLRAYDRAFWLRQMKLTGKIETYQKNLKLIEEKINCLDDSQEKDKILLQRDAEKLNIRMSDCENRRKDYKPKKGGCAFGDPIKTSSMPRNSNFLKEGK